MTAIANLPDLRPSLLLDFANSGRVDPRIQCTRASSATCFGPDGKVRTVAANVPRIDYDPATGKCLGLLVEEARTNLWLNSAVASAPQSFTTTAQAYTLSFEGTGSIALSGTFAGSLSGGSARQALVFTPTAGTLIATPTGDVVNVQLEAGAFSSSYIPTTGSATTRATDSVTISGANWLSISAGTLISEFDFGNRFRAATPAQLNNGTTANRIALFSATSSSSELSDAAAIVTVDGSVQMSASSGALTRGVRQVMAVSYSPTEYRACTNGGEVLTGSGLLPMLDRLNIGAIAGHIHRVAYYPIALTSSQLKRLTA